MSIKKLFEFVVNKEEEVDDITTAMVDGAEVKTTKKVIKKVPYKFFIKKPARNLYDEAELFYSSTLSDYIKKGLMTKAMLTKRYLEDNGIWSEGEKTEYIGLYGKLFTLETELKTLNDSDNSDKESLINEKNKSRKEIITKIQILERTQAEPFEQTAESKARNRAILWWILNISYSDDGKCLFGEGDFKTKLAKLDEIEEKEDKFMIELIKKFNYFITFWSLGSVIDKKDFEKLEGELSVNLPITS